MPTSISRGRYCVADGNELVGVHGGGVTGEVRPFDGPRVHLICAVGMRFAARYEQRLAAGEQLGLSIDFEPSAAGAAVNEDVLFRSPRAFAVVIERPGKPSDIRRLTSSPA
jgi:hypothetical protein